MNLKKALLALANGKKIRQTNWNDGVYIVLSLDEKTTCFNDGMHCSIHSNQNFEWEEYKEPLSFSEVCPGGLYDTPAKKRICMSFKTDKYIIGECENKVLVFYNDSNFLLYGLVFHD